MKKVACSSLILVILLFLNNGAKAQDSKLVASFPDNVNKILTTSCTPCHTDKGGSMAKSKLNFTAWEKYSPEKQKEKVKKMYSELEKAKMPPKGAREKHPELIPTAEQIAVIKDWSKAYPTGK